MSSRQREEQQDQRPQAVCAECKRLKLRCDKKVPCASCVRRNCDKICPDGTLARERHRENKILLVDGHDMQRKIDAMRDRVLQLEAAIAHYKVPTGTTSTVADETAGDAGESTAEICHLFGTLTIGEVETFMGPNAGSDYLLFRKRLHDTTKRGRCFLSQFVASMPFLIRVPRSTLNTIDSGGLLVALPSCSAARATVDTFFAQIAWMFGAVTHAQLRAILDKLYGKSDRPTGLNGLHVHQLALLFVVLALAAQALPDEEREVLVTRRYVAFACVCLCYEPFMERPTLYALQTIHLLTCLMNVADDHGLVTVAYNLLGLAVQLCKTLGLHRDDATWPLDDDTKQMRRSLLWTIVLYGSMLAETLGRPSSWSYTHVDARLPVDKEAFLEGGEWQQSYSAWSHSFASSCLLRVLQQPFGTTGVSHATVLQLDSIIRQHPIPPTLRTPDTETADPVSIKLELQRAMVVVLPQKMLLIVHRGFFARALEERPDDPVASAFGASVLACFRAAMYMTTAVRTLHARVPFCVRFSYIWSAAFSACVVLGSIVIKSPKCALAPAAWAEFDRTYTLFQRVSGESRTVAESMTSLGILYQKASASQTGATATLDDFEMSFIYGHTLVGQTAPNPPPPHLAMQPPDIWDLWNDDDLKFLEGIAPSRDNVEEVDSEPQMGMTWDNFMHGLGIPTSSPSAKQ